jgi:hypothetical protein
MASIRFAGDRLFAAKAGQKLVSAALPT